MNKRRSSQGKRCLECKIHNTLCFCDLVSEHETKSRVSIIMHHRERHLPSNTAVLAKRMLKDCDIFMRGFHNDPFQIEKLQITENEVPLFLFPHEDAVTLTPEYLEQFKDKRIHLVVPDGSWSQAVKCYRREKGLSDIQCVVLPPGEPGRYRLRKSNDPNRLSTYEAIARALEIIEDSKELRSELEFVFDTMVERVITTRYTFEN